MNYQKKGFNIDKKNIVIDNDINSLGYHKIQIRLHKKVISDLTIKLTRES